HILSNLALGHSRSVGSNGIDSQRTQSSVSGLSDLVVVLIQLPDLGGTAPLIISGNGTNQLEGLIADGHLADGLIAKGNSVLNLRNQDGTEQDLSNNLSGSSDTQGALADVVGDAQLLAHSGGLGLPA